MSLFFGYIYYTTLPAENQGGKQKKLLYFFTLFYYVKNTASFAVFFNFRKFCKPNVIFFHKACRRTTIPHCRYNGAFYRAASARCRHLTLQSSFFVLSTA